MKRGLYSIVLATLLAGGFWPAVLHADDIKDRMIKRLPVINELLQKGAVGESNAGLLAHRTPEKEKADIVAAENADRNAVYEKIAKTQGTSSKLVGQRRAAQIAEKAKPGTWLQNKEGTWHRK